jgi:hypothetical protein
MGFVVEPLDASVASEAHGGSGRAYMQIKNKRLVEQFDEKAAEQGQTTRLFRGVVIYVNGNTEPSKDVRPNSRRLVCHNVTSLVALCSARGMVELVEGLMRRYRFCLA